MHSREPFKTKKKLRGVRLNFTLVAAIIKELNPQKELRHSLDLSRFSVLPFLSSSKIYHACAQQDLHLLHFRLNFCSYKVPFRDFFDWKIGKLIKSKSSLQKMGFSFKKSLHELSRLHSVVLIQKTNIKKEFNDLFITHMPSYLPPCSPLPFSRRGEDYPRLPRHFCR